MLPAHALPPDVPCLVLDAGDVRPLRDAAEDPGRFQYGVPLAVNRGAEDAGRWDTVVETGELVWRLELLSSGAYSLGVVFSRFDLPPGAQVFLYDRARKELLGAYGESTENPNGVLAVQPLRSDRVTIEYVEPNRVVAFRGTWTEGPDGRVRQRLEEFDLVAQTWVVWFDGFYRRVE